MSTQDEIESKEARRDILQRIRSLQGRTGASKEQERHQALSYLGQALTGPQPDLLGDVVSLFVEKAHAMLCTVDRVPTLDQVAQAVAEYLANQKLDGSVSVWPALSSIDWSCLNRNVDIGAPRGAHLIGISGVAGAIAETGTLVFASNPNEPASTHLLPETHIAVVKADQISHTMEQAVARLRGLDRLMPRALNFVSGPSRTADIEQTIVLGAHGPYRVHLIVVG